MFTMYYKLCTFVGRWENNGSLEFLSILPLGNYSIMKEQTPFSMKIYFSCKNVPWRTEQESNYKKDSQKVEVQYLEDISRWNKT